MATTALNALLATFAPGDTLAIAEWDRERRRDTDGLEILRRVIEARADVKVLDHPALNIGGPFGQALLGLFSALTETKRDRIEKTHKRGQGLSQGEGRRHEPQAKLPDTSGAKRYAWCAMTANPSATLRSISTSLTWRLRGLHDGTAKDRSGQKHAPLLPAFSRTGALWRFRRDPRMGQGGREKTSPKWVKMPLSSPSGMIRCFCWNSGLAGCS